MSPGDAAVSVCMSAGKVIAEQADRIADLEVKVRELEAELQRRAKQIGVACMKHDLTHSLACGHCYAESRQQVERLVEALNKVKTMVCGEAAPHWSADIQTTFSRGHVADICDEALAAVEKDRT